MTTAPTHSTDLRAIENFIKVKARMLDELHKAVIGQDAVIELLFQAMLARGHCLLVGVPGLAKTLLISTLARVLKLRFNRIQFAPDRIIDMLLKAMQEPSPEDYKSHPNPASR